MSPVVCSTYSLIHLRANGSSSTIRQSSFMIIRLKELLRKNDLVFLFSTHVFEDRAIPIFFLHFSNRSLRHYFLLRNKYCKKSKQVFHFLFLHQLLQYLSCL